MHNLYCFIGRTGVGKTTIARSLAKETGLKLLKSYTTRARRENETDDNTDHIFITMSEAIKFAPEDIAAKTERVNYISFITKNMVLENDLYVVNPSGYYELKDYIDRNQMDVTLIPIIIYTSYSILIDRVKKRGDYESWEKNYNKEEDEFVNHSYLASYAFCIENNDNLSDSLQEAKHIVTCCERKVM